MSNTFSTIVEWVRGLPYWEQVGFDLLISGREASEQDITRLMNYLLEDNDLKEKTEPRKRFRFTAFAPQTDSCGDFQLISLSGLNNINALVADQKLEFGPNLTAIYGSNGSGKSGYSRILGSFGFTRGDTKVLPNITDVYDPERRQIAKITVNCDGQTREVEQIIGTEGTKFPSMYVFDTTSVDVHISDKNTMSFSPVGLSLLPALVDLTDTVRITLETHINNNMMANPAWTLLVGDSNVKSFLCDLTIFSDESEIRNLASFSESELNEFRHLKEAAAAIENEVANTKLQELTQSRVDLEALIKTFQVLEKKFDTRSIGRINQTITELGQQKKVAEDLGLKEFDDGKFKEIGSSAWRQFLHAAHTFAEIQSRSEAQKYPQKGDFCLLCQQPLSNEARNLIEKTWGYLVSDVQDNIDLTSRELRKEFSSIKSVDINFYNTNTAVYRLVSTRDKTLHKEVLTTVEETRGFIAGILEKIEKNKEITTPFSLGSIMVALHLQRDSLTKEIERWQSEMAEKEATLTKLTSFRHREILLNNLQAFQDYLARLKWSQAASSIGGNTRHITQKYSELFNELVTDAYLTLFEATLLSLGRPMAVEIHTQSRKGHFFKQLRVKADPSTPDDLSNPEEILSEGEKRAVALADFLTEVQLDNGSRTIILDDPVTSLDVDWRKQIAQVLASHAKGRQVVIFTHDLPFLYYLRTSCDEQNVHRRIHWIKRGANDDIPGYIYLDNSPALEQDYRNDTKARDCYVKSRDATAGDQVAILREGFGALRTSYEALIVFDVLNTGDSSI